MIMTPSFPIVSIYGNRDINIIDSEYSLKLMSLHQYFNHTAANCVYYDNAGLKWTLSIYSEKYKPTLLRKWLASTVFNPVIFVKRTWTQVGLYQLTELIDKIDYSIELDNDIITQFIGVDEIKAKVASCTTFECLIKALNEHVFKPEPKIICEVF